jgi:hypothetical protein
MAVQRESSEHVYAGPLALTRPRLARGVEWATFATSAAMPILSFAAGGSWWFAAPTAVVAAALVWLMTRASPRAGEVRRGRGGVLTVRRGGGRPVELALRALRDGVEVPRAGREAIEVALADGRQLTLEAKSVAESRRVLSELGLDASRRRARVALGGDADHRVRALIGMFALASLLALVPQNLSWIRFAWVPLAFAWVSFAALFLSSGRAGVVALVGLDGVEIRSRDGVRFAPLAGVERARVRAPAVGMGVDLELADGTRETLVRAPGAAKERVRALALKVEEALRARRRLGAPEYAPRLLERGARSFSEWTLVLRGLGRGGDDYRASAVPVEDLAAVLEDPDATAEQRIGAALVLDGTGDPAARTRVRVAAETSASSSMRVALAAIAEADPDEDAIADALAEDASAAARRLAT